MGFFYFVAIMVLIAMKVNVQDFVWTYVFNSLGYIHRKVIPGRCGHEGGILMKRLKVKVKSLSRVRLFATPWTVAHQAPPSMGFSRQEY